MSEFKVGDRVLVKSKSTDYSYFSSFKTGLIGKVLSSSNLSEVVDKILAEEEDKK